MEETLAGSAFLAHAASYEFGNVRNISCFERNGRNMICFLTVWCEGQQESAAESARIGGRVSEPPLPPILQKR